MKAKLINKNPKTFVIVFDTDDEVMEGLENFAREQRLSASHFTAIGAFREAVLGFFQVAKCEYKRCSHCSAISPWPMASPSSMRMSFSANPTAQLTEDICSKVMSGRRSKSSWSSQPNIYIVPTIGKPAFN